MLSGAGSGFLAGKIEWVVDKFIFQQSPSNRTGTLTASPQLETTAGTRTTISQVGTSATNHSSNTTADEQYGRCTMDIAQIAWDPITQMYRSVAQQSFHAYQFNPNMAGINTAPQSNGQYSGSGYWLIYGVSEKVAGVGHKMTSDATGDSTLAAQGNFSYTATLTFTLSDLAFGNGSWNWIPRRQEAERSTSLSATGPASSSLSLLESNTRLHSTSTAGGSQLSWQKIPGTAVNTAIYVGVPAPVKVSVPVAVWKASQATW